MMRTEASFMPEKRFKRVVRLATVEERERHATIRRTVVEEYPPAEGAGRSESPPGIHTQIPGQLEAALDRQQRQYDAHARLLADEALVRVQFDLRRQLRQVAL